MATRVMIMAGGTGGHVYPALAVAFELISRGCNVTWLGTPNSFESDLVKKNNITFDAVNAFRMRGIRSFHKLFLPIRLIRAMWQAYKVINNRKPQVILGMGGFVSAPGGLIARVLGLPLIIHEQNAIPGLANRVLSRFSTLNIEAFPNSFSKKTNTRVCGNPIRNEIIDLPDSMQRFSQPSEKPLQLVVLGGSLGASILNDFIPKALSFMKEEDRPNVIHQSGAKKFRETLENYRNYKVKGNVFEYLEDMASIYLKADFVICRAGALTLSELAAAGLPSILIPLPFSADDHQTYNATYFADEGAAKVINQKDLDPLKLANFLKEIFENRSILEKMAYAAKRKALLDATVCVSNACMELAA